MPGMPQEHVTGVRRVEAPPRQRARHGPRRASDPLTYLYMYVWVCIQ